MMGTRGAFGIRYGEQDKLVYNHFDSYPEGLGDKLFQKIQEAIVAHQSAGGTWDALLGKWRGQALAGRLIRANDGPPTEAEKQRCRDLDLVDLRVSQQTEDDWYCLLRNVQGNIMKLLEVGLFLDGNDFILDSLFCEWAYILNLDTVEFEVYRGFQRKPHQRGRYASITTMVEEYERRNVERQARIRNAGKDPVDSYLYYPCALVATMPLRELPKHASLVHYLDETGVFAEIERDGS